MIERGHELYEDAMPRTRSTTTSLRHQQEFTRTERGFSLIEVSVAVAVIGILTTIGASVIVDKMHEARLARCKSELRSIQSTYFTHFGDAMDLPDEQTFWDRAWKGSAPGPYRVLFLTGDANRGHGNDLDECDEDNPGKSRECTGKGTLVFLCQHFHASLADYQYAVDEGEPTIADEFNDPGYADMLDARNPGNGGEGGGGVGRGVGRGTGRGPN